MKFLKKLLGLEDDKVIGLCAFNKKNAKTNNYYAYYFNSQNQQYNTNTKNNFFLL